MSWSPRAASRLSVVAAVAFCAYPAGLLLTSCNSAGGGLTSVADSFTQARFADGSYISWKEHLIDDEESAGGVPIRGGDGLQMADLDKDGYLDVVSVHEDSHHIRVAFASDDPNGWVHLTLVEGPEAGAAEDVAVGDLNGDGYLDVIAACESGHLIYLQNPGAGARERRWERVIPNVTTNRGSFIRVFFADFNQDGKLEVVAANKGTGRDEAATAAKPDTEISWFEVPLDPLDGSHWQEHALTRVRWPINAQPIDLDGDGDRDVLGGSNADGPIFWFENLGGQEVGFQEHPIIIADQAAAHAGQELAVSGFNVDFFDLSDDGRLDVITGAGQPEDGGFQPALVWLEQPSHPSEPWKLHRIGALAPDNLVGLVASDINADGHPDVMTGGYSQALVMKTASG